MTCRRNGHQKEKGIKMEKNFNLALARFVNYCELMCNRPSHPVTGRDGKELPIEFHVKMRHTFETMTGRKYVRVVRTDGNSRSAHCFVSMETGEVFMTASWKKPAKHARGTIYTTDPKEYGVGQYGAHYLR